MVNHVQMQSFFQTGGNAKHPLFVEFHILCHICHGHIAVHKNRFLGTGERSCPEKVQFALFHLFDAIIVSGRGQVKRHSGNLQLVKSNQRHIFVQVKFVQLFQIIPDALRCFLFWFAAAKIPGYCSSEIRMGEWVLCGAAIQQLADQFHFLGSAVFPQQKSAQALRKFRDICRHTLPFFDSRKIRRVIAHAFGKFAQID
ncbi:unknown [Ruminococcus sp. CAG:330]|nr:unknown [Ruminococcus sp. CAG:330]